MGKKGALERTQDRDAREFAIQGVMLARLLRNPGRYVAQSREFAIQGVMVGVRHKDLVDRMGVISVRLLRRIGDYRLPLHVAPAMNCMQRGARYRVVDFKCSAGRWTQQVQGAARFGKLRRGIAIARGVAIAE